jgi:hypothetical protein
VILERAARVEEDVAICCSIVPSRWGMVACVGAFPEGTHGSRWSGNGCGRRGVSVTGSITPFWVEQKANIIVTLVEIMIRFYWDRNPNKR